MKALLATALATALAAGPVAASAQTLTIAGRDGAYADALEIAVEAFLAENPGVEVERLELTGGGLLDSLTIAMREGSDAYDVIMLDDPWAPQFMSRGWLAEMPELDEDFVKPARDVSRHPYAEGPYYAVPFVGNVELFAYNRAILDRHGLAAPTSWTEVVEAARAIDEAEPEIAGAVFRGQKANPIVTGFLPILWAHGARVVEADGTAGLDTQNALAALNLWLELARHAPEGVVNYDSTEVRDALQQGTAAMSIEVWPAWIPALDDPERSRVVGEVEIMAAPGEVEGPAPMLGAWMVAIPETSANKALAMDFVAFLTSPEMQKRLALEVGTPPTRASVYADEEVVSAYRWYPAQVAALKEAQPRPRIEEWSRVEQVLGDYLQLALIGEMTAEEAFAEADERIDAVLAN